MHESNFLCYTDRTEMKSVNDKQLSELQQEIDTEKSEIEAAVLQQKMTDKQISKIVNSQKSLRDELEKMQADRETLLLEIMDLELGNLFAQDSANIGGLSFPFLRLHFLTIMYFQKWKRERGIRSCNGTLLNVRVTSTSKTWIYT